MVEYAAERNMKVKSWEIVGVALVANAAFIRFAKLDSAPKIFAPDQLWKSFLQHFVERRNLFGDVNRVTPLCA